MIDLRLICPGIEYKFRRFGLSFDGVFLPRLTCANTSRADMQIQTSSASAHQWYRKRAPILEWYADKVRVITDILA